MRIKLFGQPSVWRDEQPVGGALTQRRRLALVAVLAAGAPPGRAGLPRERLLALLWPSDDEQRSRAALSQALYAVRRDLGADDAIVGTTDLRLNPERISCDYWEFLQALAEGADSHAAELRTAPLMDGLELAEAPELERWVEEQRTDADRQWANAAERVAAAATANGNTAIAVRWRRALANADPLSGRTAAALAKALAANGEREAALRHLRIHAALVEQELETSPGAEVAALIDTLRHPPNEAPADSAASTGAGTPGTAADAQRSHGVETGAGAGDVEAANAPHAADVARRPAESPPARGDALLTGWSRRTAWWPAVVILLAAVVAAALAWDGPSGSSEVVQAEPAIDAPATGPATVFAIGTIDGDALGSAAAGMMETNLARAAGVEVIGTARMLDLARTTAATSSILDAARSAGATDLVDGTLLRNGRTWRLDLRRTDLTSGRVVTAARGEGDDLFSAVDRASSELLLAVSRDVLEGSIADVSTRSIEAWRLFEQWKRAHVEGRRDAGVVALRGALRADSTFAIAALTLANVLGTESPEYLPLLRQALRMSDHASPQVRQWIRVSWLSATDDPGAGPAVDSMAARYPRDLDVQMMVAGPAVFARGDFATAIRALIGVWRADSAFISRPGRARCYACEATIHLHTTFMNADSLEAAERWTRKLLALRPDDGQAWSRLASVLERDVARHTALDAVIDSAVIAGEPGARVWRLYAATRRGDTLAFNEALGAPGVGLSGADLHWARTVLYRNAGRLDDALREAQAYARALGDVTPETRRQRRGLEAMVLLELGRGREAAVIWDSIARAPRPEVTPSRVARQSTFFSTLAATARYEAGDTTGLAALADTLAITGARSGYARDRVLHYHVRGLAMLARGRVDEAIAELRQAVVYPNAGFTRTNWHLALALERAGRPAEARAWLLAASRAPRDASSLYLSPVAARQRAERLRR